MTHPLTPREKVARALSPKCWEFYDRHVDDPRMAAEIKHEVAPSLDAADAIFTALASGSGDHAELAAKAQRCTTGDPWYKDEDLLGRQSFGQFLPQDRAFIAAANPAAVLALLAEIAALRAEVSQANANGASHWSRATEAERNLAEAVGLLRRIAETPSDQFDDVAEADKIRTFLSKEAERG